MGMKKLLLLALLSVPAFGMNHIRKLVVKLAPKQQKTKNNIKVIAGAVTWVSIGFWKVNKDLKAQGAKGK